MSNNLKAIIFDFDGVITDGLSFHLEAYNSVFQKRDLKVDLNSLNRKLHLSAKEIFSEIWETKNIRSQMTEAIEEHRAILLDLYRTEAKIAVGLIPFLQNCREMNLTLCVGSSCYTECIDVVLQRFNIHNYFQTILGGDIIINAKPKPDIYEKALKHVNIDGTDINYSETLAIESSKIGIETALGLGMKVVAISAYSSDDLQKASLVVDDFSKLNFTHNFSQ